MNAGVLVDPIHFDRAGSTPAQLAAIAPHRLAYLQFCDAPTARPRTITELLRQARSDRLLPGDGGLDLRGLLSAMPAHSPLSLEIPFDRPPGLPARERALSAIKATQRWLAAAI
jgi:sugar phosphate isomerase/epimerase